MIGHLLIPKGAAIVSLSERLAAPPAPKATKTVMDRWIESLTETDAAAVKRAILDTGWRHIDLQRALEAEGAPKIADTSFGTWRRKRAETWA